MSQIVTHRPVVLIDELIPDSVRRNAASVLLVVGGALLVGLAAQIRFPLGFTPVPVSGQTFAVLVVGTSMGALRGGLSLGLYMLLGLVGLPVYAGGNFGIAYAFGPTGGYLIGFIVAAALLGYLAERHLDRRIHTALPGLLLACLVIYAFGTAGLMLVTGASLSRALELGVAPFVIGDLFKVLLAAIALPSAWALATHTTRAPGACASS